MSADQMFLKSALAYLENHGFIVEEVGPLSETTGQGDRCYLYSAGRERARISILVLMQSDGAYRFYVPVTLSENIPDGVDALAQWLDTNSCPPAPGSGAEADKPTHS